MSSTIGGVRIVDMPDLGAVNDTSSMVGERAGSGRFSAPALKTYTSVGLAPVASVPGLNARSYGAMGDGVTDDTAALQAAINAAVAAQQMLYIPGGRYRLTAALLITRGVRIIGAYAEPQVAMFTASPNMPGNGTWLMLEAAHLVSAFFINPTGTPSANNQAMGVEIGCLGIYHQQPVPGAGWAPAAYPPAIDIPAGSDINLHDLCLFNPTTGIRAAGQSAGRLVIERISGQPLTNGIILDNQTDTVTIRDIHFWVNWSVNLNVLAHQQSVGFGIILGRIDNPVIDNFLCLWYWVGCGITATANGSANAVRITNSDFDECGNPFTINDAIGGHSVYMTGCLLSGQNTTGAPGIAAAPGSGVLITGAGGSNMVYLTACAIENVGYHCIANGSTGSGSSHVRLSACRLWNWDIVNTGNYCMQASAGNTIRADAATLTYSVNSNANVVTGGQCIKEPVTFITEGTMASGATSSAALPHTLGAVPQMILVSPQGGPTAATEWWGIADASQVTVHTNVAPGSTLNFGVMLGVAN